ncbi:hypothetical protein GEMRC1_007251 [Eukaryota sp. GEM-RC1]
MLSSLAVTFPLIVDNLVLRSPWFDLIFSKNYEIKSSCLELCQSMLTSSESSAAYFTNLLLDNFPELVPSQEHVYLNQFDCYFKLSLSVINSLIEETNFDLLIHFFGLISSLSNLLSSFISAAVSIHSFSNVFAILHLCLTDERILSNAEFLAVVDFQHYFDITLLTSLIHIPIPGVQLWPTQVPSDFFSQFFDLFTVGLDKKVVENQVQAELAKIVIQKFVPLFCKSFQNLNDTAAIAFGRLLSELFNYSINICDSVATIIRSLQPRSFTTVQSGFFIIYGLLLSRNGKVFDCLTKLDTCKILAKCIPFFDLDSTSSVPFVESLCVLVRHSVNSDIFKRFCKTIQSDIMLLLRRGLNPLDGNQNQQHVYKAKSVIFDLIIFLYERNLYVTPSISACIEVLSSCCIRSSKQFNILLCRFFLQMTVPRIREYKALDSKLQQNCSYMLVVALWLAICSESVSLMKQSFDLLKSLVVCGGTCTHSVCDEYMKSIVSSAVESHYSGFFFRDIFPILKSSNRDPNVFFLPFLPKLATSVRQFLVEIELKQEFTQLFNTQTSFDDVLSLLETMSTNVASANYINFLSNVLLLVTGSDLCSDVPDDVVEVLNQIENLRSKGLLPDMVKIDPSCTD